MRIKHISPKRGTFTLFFGTPATVCASGLTVDTIDELLSEEWRDTLRATRRILTGGKRAKAKTPA